MADRKRKAKVERKSKETSIVAELNIDGAGKACIQTPIGLLNHMLELFAFHGFFDLTLKVKKADTKIDIHHTNEDIGIVLGQAFKKALGEKTGIRRFGSAFAPMEDTLGQCVIDISGRGHLRTSFGEGAPFTEVSTSALQTEEGYSLQNLEHFLDSFAKQLGANIIISIQSPSAASADLHTVTETVFKALGLALDEATEIESRRRGKVPSTKGIID